MLIELNHHPVFILTTRISFSFWGLFNFLLFNNAELLIQDEAEKEKKKKHNLLAAAAVQQIYAAQCIC